MKSKIILALAAGIIGLSASAHAAIVFQDINQTLTDGQTYRFGFDGTSLTLGSGSFVVTYTAPVQHPASNDGYYGYQPAYTSPAYLDVSTGGWPNPTIYGGSGAVTSGLTGNESGIYNSGWGQGSKSYTPSPTVVDSPTYTYFLPGPGKSGWMEFSLNGSSAFIGAIGFSTTNGYATVGDTGAGLYVPAAPPSTSPVPEPSSQLALIALVSAGVLTRRRANRRTGV